jgi:hypothetical protein
MKWTEFRELPPLERRRRRRSKSHGMQSRLQYLSSAFKRLPHGDLEKYPDMRQAAEIICGYAFSNTPEEIKAWLDWRVDIIGHKDGWQRLVPFQLFILGKTYPSDVFGFFDEDNRFVPGILPLLAHKRGVEDLYTDALDDILCEEDLSGKKIDEVVYMAHKRGMKCSNEVVRKRVQDWDRGKPEISSKKSHTR